jgi:signal recognition particle subunit SRP19
MSKKGGLVVVWPAYLDIQRSRLEGRMVAKSFAVESPTADEIYEVCRELGYEPILESTKKLPRFSWERSGRVLVIKKDKKLKMLKEISRALQRKRILRKS